MRPRVTAPNKPLGYRTTHAQSFRVWSFQPLFLEDDKPWKCVAAFYYLSECLDYIATRQDCGSDVVFESPAETKLIRATDRRVVYKTEVA